MIAVYRLEDRLGRGPFHADILKDPDWANGGFGFQIGSTGVHMKWGPQHPEPSFGMMALLQSGWLSGSLAASDMLIWFPRHAIEAFELCGFMVSLYDVEDDAIVDCDTPTAPQVVFDPARAYYRISIRSVEL